MPKDIISENEEGDSMLAKKIKGNKTYYIDSKKEDVAKAIMKSNKKHKKMMKMLAK